MSEPREALAGADEREIPSESRARGHELRDVSPRSAIGIVLVLVVLVVVAVVVAAALKGAVLESVADRSPPANPLAATYGRKIPPAPLLQVDPLHDLVQLHASEDALLESYAWVDRPLGVVRIPIERALELTAERGLPARTASPAAKVGSTP
jgi:hypothetical protein